MKRIAIVLSIVVVSGCDGFIGEVSVRPAEGAAAAESLSSADPTLDVEPAIDPRQLSASFAGADEATLVNPGMDYRFVLAVTNHSNRIINSLEGVTSVRSATGSDLLVNHPFRVSGLNLLPGATGQLRLEVPVSASVASRSSLQFQIVSAEAGSRP
jgi:hypothetical protein